MYEPSAEAVEAAARVVAEVRFGPHEPPLGTDRRLAGAVLAAAVPVVLADVLGPLRELAEGDGWFDPTALQHHVEDFRDGIALMQSRLRAALDAIPAQAEDGGRA